MKRIISLILSGFLTIVLIFAVVGCGSSNSTSDSNDNASTAAVAGSSTFDYSLVPAWSGSEDDPYAVINDNIPYFTPEDFTTTSYESYSELDKLGRVGVAMACLGQDLMPTEERGDIGSVYPTGWVQNKYDIVSGGYVVNRCHLIAFELAGENANKQNLATGTRFLNISGMLPFENMTADYIKETNNHVMYRITPVFLGNNLLMEGLLMEAESVEDNGDGIMYCVWCYNVQPGICFDYATGDNWEE